VAQILFAILKTIRPRQWLKNIAVFSPVFLTGNLFINNYFIYSLLGFIAYCLLSSSNYIVNDILDSQSDRKHPFKKFRPIASGKISINLAMILSVICAILGLLISAYLGNSFLILAMVFLTLQYLYSLLFKKISVVDILVITAGYFIRVYAGEAATGLHISVWLALAALSLALFLAIGKRRAELTLIQGYKGILLSETRESLLHYSEKLLDTYTGMFASSTFITYAFYSFLERPSSPGFFLKGVSDNAPDFIGRKWMMATIPFVLFGIMRYMQLIYEGEGESPEKILTSDKALLLTVILWIITIFIVVYGIGG
jgi:decaprenyl-phosphate phosphoribosyltransferase